MSSPASIGKHPIHPMLVAFPIGLWVFSLISDLIFLAGGSPEWEIVAFYTMIGGTIGGMTAAVPGFIDYFAVKDRDAQRIATTHMVLNAVIITLYVVNILQRAQHAETAGLAIFLSIAGNILLVISGWLGGHLVFVHGVAVEPQKREQA